LSTLKLPSDFATKIAETINWKLAIIDDFFEISEDKEGYFWAKLRPKKFLDKPDFSALCKLTRTLGGEDYLQGARAWKIPGPYVKKPAKPETAKPEADKGPKKEPASPYALLPIQTLYSMPFQSRIIQEDPELDELAENIKVFGLLQPILVRPKTSGLYEIVYGERRVSAAKKAGLVEVPANIKTLTDQEAYEIQLVENIQRKDLTDTEKARMLDMMIKKFKYTQEQLAKKLGKNQNWVSRHLAMLQVPNIIPRGIMETGEFTERQAREIIGAPEDKRAEIIDKINETGQVPSVREIHEITHPEEKSKVVICARCGEPIEGTPVHLGEGKFYDAECAEQEVAEAKASALPESHVGPFEERETESEEHVLPKPTEPEMHVTEGTSYDVADFTCPQCHQSFRIVHLPNGKHKIEPVREQA
jgi:ParB/RepB/Spo0J family partition protein